MKVSGDIIGFGDYAHMELVFLNDTHFTAPAHWTPPYVQTGLTF